MIDHTTQTGALAAAVHARLERLLQGTARL